MRVASKNSCLRMRSKVSQKRDAYAIEHYIYIHPFKCTTSAIFEMFLRAGFALTREELLKALSQRQKLPL